MSISPEAALKVKLFKLFPEDCGIATMSDGHLSVPAILMIDEWASQYTIGKDLEHPCYGCRRDNCDFRRVGYHDENKRYMINLIL